MLLGILGVVAGALLIVPLSRPSPTPPLPTACHERRKQECEEDSECAWHRGKGCKDTDHDRYFSTTAFIDSDDAERKKAFCRCVLHLMAKGVQKPYGICARSTGTSTGGKPCKYDFESIPETEVRAYARHLERRGEVKKGFANSKDVRMRVKEWYERDKK